MKRDKKQMILCWVPAVLGFWAGISVAEEQWLLAIGLALVCGGYLAVVPAFLDEIPAA